MRASTWLCAVAVCLVSETSAAQLRPLEASWFDLFRGDRTLAASIGASRLSDQRASLAGTEGTLWEAGNFNVAWRTGRVVLSAGGTAQRYFSENRRFDDAYTDVDPAPDGKRHDSGDYRVSTTVRLTPNRFPVDGVLRFGTRLPTTDNTTGLDRDAIDFFATVGAGTSRSYFDLSAETGLGIHSTREQRFEQDDLFLYALSAEYARWMIVPSIAAVGQIHGTGHSEIRGVEDLGEVRFGLRFGRRNWLRADIVKGYETFSPSSGFIVTAGIFR
jgi:hypothetical protein